MAVPLGRSSLSTKEHPVAGMLSEVPRKFLVDLWSHPSSGTTSTHLLYVCWSMMTANTERHVNLNVDQGNLKQNNVKMGCIALKHLSASVHSHSAKHLALFPNDHEITGAVVHS